MGVEEDAEDSFQFIIKTGGGQVDLKWSAYANHFSFVRINVVREA